MATFLRPDAGIHTLGGNFHGTYGINDPHTARKASNLTKVKRMIHESKRPSVTALIGMVVVPWLIFVCVYYIRGFDLHYTGEGLCQIFSLALPVPIAFFGYMAFNLAKDGSNPIPMVFLTVLAALCWAAGFILGNQSFTMYMKPYYELTNMNSYPRIDPAKWQGSQLMDAGMIQFMKGSRISLAKSMGFKNDDIYCVAPVVFKNTTTDALAPMDSYDFWAVGVNCCSGHAPDFQCGEYSNPDARWGLRVMDYDAREMFRLAVKEAEASYNIKAPHPIFLHWMMDPEAEVQAYKDDGARFLMKYAGTVFLGLLAIVMTFALLINTMC
jgi:hypothetical protein